MGQTMSHVQLNSYWCVSLGTLYFLTPGNTCWCVIVEELRWVSLGCFLVDIVDKLKNSSVTLFFLSVTRHIFCDLVKITIIDTLMLQHSVAFKCSSNSLGKARFSSNRTTDKARSMRKCLSPQSHPIPLRRQKAKAAFELFLSFYIYNRVQHE